MEQVYLGAEDEVIARLAGRAGGGDPALPDATVHRRFGDVAAVWGMLTRLEAAAVIDGVVGDAKVPGGTTVGSYLALAALNRVCDPRSKAGFAEWSATTSLGRITGLPAEMLDHRRFWEAMDRVDLDRIDAVEAALTRRMIEVFGLDTHGLVLDMTNFATFIDSTNTRAPVAARGKAKQKRSRGSGLGRGSACQRNYHVLNHFAATARAWATRARSSRWVAAKITAKAVRASAACSKADGLRLGSTGDTPCARRSRSRMRADWPGDASPIDQY